MRKILVLGTGSAQRDIIEYCKENGLHVIAVSNVSGYMAEKLADEFYQIDIVDVDALEKLAREKEVDLIYSVGSDIAMPTVAEVSERLSLPTYIEKDTALVCNKKNELRKLIQDRNIEGSVPYQVLNGADDEITIPFPAIMKPLDSQGQRGVRRVDSAEEIRDHFEETLSYSREKKVILERYIDGSEISVNVFLKDGEIVFYLISDRITWSQYPGGIIHEHVIPSKYEKDPNITARIRKLVEECLDAIGLKEGPGYFQIKVSSQGYPYLIEVTPRLDGCHMWRLIRYSTGVDLMKASVGGLLGEGYEIPEEYPVKAHSLEFLCDAPGNLFSENNYELPEHVFLRWYYREGQKVNKTNGYCEKCGYVIKEGLPQ